MQVHQFVQHLIHDVLEGQGGRRSCSKSAVSRASASRTYRAATACGSAPLSRVLVEVPIESPARSAMRLVVADMPIGEDLRSRLHQDGQRLLGPGLKRTSACGTDTGDVLEVAAVATMMQRCNFVGDERHAGVGIRENAMAVFARRAPTVPDVVRCALRQLHRRSVGRTGGRPYFENLTPGDRPGVLRGRPLDRGRRRSGARRRARRRTGLGHYRGGRARADPQPDRRPDGAEPRSPRASPRPGTTASRCARRSRRRSSRWPSTTSATSRARVRAQEGSRRRDRRRHRRLPLPRAARRRRPDHPVELPDPDGGVEAGAGAGRRQLRGAQAGRADPGLDPLPGRR